MQILARECFGRTWLHLQWPGQKCWPCGKNSRNHTAAQTFMDHGKDSGLSNGHERKPSEQAEQRRGMALKGLVLTGNVKAKRPNVNEVKEEAGTQV